MYTEKLIKSISEKTGIDISKFDMNELVMGMEVELEHGSSNEKTDVTDDDPIKTFKIVMAHMYEMPDYYTKLKAMENEKEHISEYAKRMRELAGLSEGNQNKSLKTIQEGKSSFEDGVTFMAKDFMTSNDVVKENFDAEEFTPHGSYTVSNSGGYEIMLNDSGDAAKVRDAYGSDNPETSDWMEIEYVPGEDGESEPVIDPSGYNIPLNQVMRINESKTTGSNSEEFETHKFEQKTIEEGADDEELYTLNENTIIVLDFLNENEEPLEGDMYYEIQVLSSPEEVDKIVRIAESMLDMFPNGIARRGSRFLGFKTEEEKYNFTDLLDNSEVNYKDFGIKPGALNN